MRRSSNYRRSSFVGRRRRRNIIPLATVALALVLLLWIGGRFLGRLFSDTRSEVASASIQIQRGRAEFSLPDNDQWTPAYSDQEFLSGDSVRTSANSRASLEFLGGNVVFLDQNTEITFQTIEEDSSGEKTAKLKLIQGRIWARVSEDDFGNNSDSVFTVETPRTLVHVRGTIFDLSTNTGQDTIRLVKGSVDADIFTDEKKDDFLNIKIGVGQKLVVTPQNIERLKNKEDVLEIMDTEFIESEWHLQNLERFFPQEVSQIRRRIEVSAPKIEKSDSTASLETSTDVEPPQITAPADGTHIPATQDAIQVEGTAPLQAVQIVVNGYTLTRFQPGDRKWAYFAATKFGTLVSGENKFSVVAVSRDGKKSAPAELTIFYEGAGARPASEPETPSEQKDSINGFSNPVITKPGVLDSNAYQTSSDVVTISGIVDPKTNAVEVNGFRLQKFQPGQTAFSYIANARYGNMREGENVYEVVAFGPDGKKASSTIKIVYTPINVTP